MLPVFLYSVGGLAIASSTTKSFTFEYNQTGSLGNPWVGLVPYSPGGFIKPEFPHSMENQYFSFAQLMTNWHTFDWTPLDGLFTRMEKRVSNASISYI
jgi:hypothetical protein